MNGRAFLDCGSFAVQRCRHGKPTVGGRGLDCPSCQTYTVRMGGRVYGAALAVDESTAIREANYARAARDGEVSIVRDSDGGRVSERFVCGAVILA